MSVRLAKPEHEVAYQVGKLVAMQDQRTVTPELAMETVAQNLEAGNRMVLEQLSATKGRG